jgi:hypothetical protein
MKTLTSLKNKLSVTFLALACSFVAQGAIAGPVNEMDDHDFIRVTVPEADMADLRLVYAVDGNKVEATAKGGDVVKLHAEGNDILGIQSFTATREGDTTYTLQMGVTQPLGLDHIISFAATGESVTYEGDAPIYINGDNVTVEVVPGGNKDEIINEAPQPIVIDEQVKSFSKVGFLEIRFVAKAPEVDDGGDQDNGDNQDFGDNAEAGSGGCSMVVGATGGSPLSLASFAAVSALGLMLRRRAQRK